MRTTLQIAVLAAITFGGLIGTQNTNACDRGGGSYGQFKSQGKPYRKPMMGGAYGKTMLGGGFAKPGGMGMGSFKSAGGFGAAGKELGAGGTKSR